MDEIKIQETYQFYNKIVDVSGTNLLISMDRGQRKVIFIPTATEREKELLPYHIEIAKIIALISKHSTIAIEVNCFKDFIFLLKLKWSLRKNICNIKKAKKEDINNDINEYTDYMKKVFNITDKTFIDIYKLYFKR